MSDEDPVEGDLSDWGKSRASSRNSVRSDAAEPSLTRSRSHSRGDLRALSPEIIVKEELPEDLHTQLGELLDNEKTRDTLVDTMVAMTHEAQINNPDRNVLPPNRPMGRAGSPTRNVLAPVHPAPPLVPFVRNDPVGLQAAPRAAQGWSPTAHPGPYFMGDNPFREREREKGLDEVIHSFEHLGLGGLTQREQRLLMAFAKTMTQHLVPRLRNEISADALHDSLITREHKLGMIRAPTNFPDAPVLVNMDRATANQYQQFWLHAFKQKFSGEAKKGKFGRAVVTADYILNRALSSHYFFPLSEPEFRYHLLNICEDPAWTKVSGWMHQQLPLQEIFNKILACYDKREKSDEALAKLESLKFFDFDNWAEIEAEIERLCMRASLARVSVTGEGQRDLFNYLGTKHIIDILPEIFRLEAERRISTYCNGTRNELTFHTLIALIEKDRLAIDRMLAEKSAGRRKKREGGDLLAITHVDGRKNDAYGNPKNRGKNDVRQVASAPKKATAGEVNFVGFQKQGANGRGYETKPRESLCRKCKVPGHEEAKCPHYDGLPSKYMCNYCHMEAYHNKDRCLFKVKAVQRRGDKGPEGPRHGAKPNSPKN